MMLLTLMMFVSMALFVSAQTANDAPVTENNPKMATFQAVLQQHKPVQGQITGVSGDNGTGVNFSVNFFAFPDASAGPFAYHIHEFAVPADGNCTGTGGHLSPYGRNETPACVSAQPNTCQPGDLSGKHEVIANTARNKNFQVTYLDLYLSTDPQDLTFFGNRSVVVHAANGTRLNCGNFTQQLAAGGNGTASGGTPAPTSTNAGVVNTLAYEARLVLGAGMLVLVLGLI